MSSPAPMLSEKMACPMAASTPVAVRLPNSGLKRKLIPSLLPGKVSERTQSSSIMKNKTGMTILVNFSMPFCTPPMTTAPVRKTSKPWKRMGR